MNLKIIYINFFLRNLTTQATLIHSIQKQYTIFKMNNITISVINIGKFITEIYFSDTLYKTMLQINMLY